LKIHFNVLQQNGFEKHGNWWLKSNIAINLVSNNLKHTQPPMFCVEDVNETITLKDVYDFAIIMAKMTGYHIDWDGVTA